MKSTLMIEAFCLEVRLVIGQLLSIFIQLAILAVIQDCVYKDLLCLKSCTVIVYTVFCEVFCKHNTSAILAFNLDPYVF